VADGEYGLLLGFDTDDPQFTRGFELGRIWEIAKTFDGPFEEIVHGVNAEMLIRIAEATDRKVRSTDDGDGWLTACFSEIGDDFVTVGDD
jgi:hypothetical protein